MKTTVGVLENKKQSEKEVCCSCEIEFSQLPTRSFKLDLTKLNLSINGLKNGSASILKIRYDEAIHFPTGLLVAFRVHDDFLLDEQQGLTTLIESGFSVLMDGLNAKTDLKSILAAMFLQQRLGIKSSVGNLCREKAKEVVKYHLEDIILVEETFSELRFPLNQPKNVVKCEEISQMQKEMQERIFRLEKENASLIKALNDAYKTSQI